MLIFCIIFVKKLVKLFFFRIFAANFILTAKLCEILSNFGLFVDLLYPFAGLLYPSANAFAGSLFGTMI